MVFFIKPFSFYFVLIILRACFILNRLLILMINQDGFEIKLNFKSLFKHGF